jgi:hypothetical protein
MSLGALPAEPGFTSATRVWPPGFRAVWTQTPAQPRAKPKPAAPAAAAPAADEGEGAAKDEDGAGAAEGGADAAAQPGEAPGEAAAEAQAEPAGPPAPPAHRFVCEIRAALAPGAAVGGEAARRAVFAVSLERNPEAASAGGGEGGEAEAAVEVAVGPSANAVWRAVVGRQVRACRLATGGCCFSLTRAAGHAAS